MSENFQSLNMNDKKEDRKAAYTQLIGLSILSSLAILSLWLFFPVLAHKMDPTGGLGGILALWPIMIAQWLLIGPATGAVIFIHKRQRDALSVNSSLQTDIPLIANILAANALFVTLPVIYFVYELGLVFHIWGYMGH